jgi:hypothetical protein
VFGKHGCEIAWGNGAKLEGPLPRRVSASSETWLRLFAGRSVALLAAEFYRIRDLLEARMLAAIIRRLT